VTKNDLKNEEEPKIGSAALCSGERHEIGKITLLTFFPFQLIFNIRGVTKKLQIRRSAWPDKPLIFSAQPDKHPEWHFLITPLGYEKKAGPSLTLPLVFKWIKSFSCPFSPPAQKA
jgi:hypothetical protein